MIRFRLPGLAFASVIFLLMLQWGIPSACAEAVRGLSAMPGKSGAGLATLAMGLRSGCALVGDGSVRC